MHVAVGPVDSASAKAWIGFARDVVDRQTGGTISDDLRVAFDTYLDEWSTIADSGPVFRWALEIDAEVVEYLVHGFYRVAEVITEQAQVRGSRISPVEGDAFYAALVNALLDALGEESPANAEFASYLRAFWPGIAPESL